jgi:uncharacterized membrane protein YwaF
MSSRAPAAASVANKVGHELRKVVVISGYLYICFAALIFYKAAILWGQGISYTPYGLAAVKALVLGKFVLLGNAAKIGDRYTSRRFVHVVAQKSILFLALLLVLTLVEELIIGAFKGRSVANSIAETTGGSLLMILASSVLMLLILVPYVVFQELDRTLGEGKLRQILLERQVGLRAGEPGSSA